MRRRKPYKKVVDGKSAIKQLHEDLIKMPDFQFRRMIFPLVRTIPNKPYVMDIIAPWRQYRKQSRIVTCKN